MPCENGLKGVALVTTEAGLGKWSVVLPAKEGWVTIWSNYNNIFSPSNHFFTLAAP